jgi:hypothetical protein
MDGGTVWNVNISSAINGCLGMGFEERQIYVDVMICADPTINSEYIPGHTLNNFIRGHAISKYYWGGDAI